jgi:hypothetical protein
MYFECLTHCGSEALRTATTSSYYMLGLHVTSLATSTLPKLTAECHSSIEKYRTSMCEFLSTYYYCNLNIIYDLLVTSTPSKEQLH